MSNKAPSYLEYYETREFTVTLRNQNVRFISKPGISYWNTVTPAVALLADTVEVSAGSRILLLGCGHGALGVTLARAAPGADVLLVDTNSVALAMAERTLRLNGVSNARIHPDLSVLPVYADSFDIVVMVLPRGREFTRRWLVESFSALKNGGRLYLAGANREGIKSAVSDMKSLFGNSVTLAYKRGGRVSVAAKEDPIPRDTGWADEPGILPGTWRQFQAEVCGETFLLRSLPGVFSYDEIDEGTRLLLEVMDVSPGSSVLDLGCGYGIIGLLAARKGAGHVDLADVDLPSTASVGENIILNDVTGAEVIVSDLLSGLNGKRYDIILTNPPFHTGFERFDIAGPLVVHAREILEPDGRLVVVAGKFLRYDRLMGNVFGNVCCLSETNHYHVLMSTKY